MKHEAISVYSSEFSVVKMCEALEIEQRGYYQWLKGEEKRIEKRKAEIVLVEQVTEVFNESFKTYGYRRMHEALLAKGIKISEYRTKKIMRENGLYPETIKKQKPYPKQKNDNRYSENEIQQEFNYAESNKCWAGDITYIKTFIGWVYLAVVLDLFNREVIGYSISKKVDTELVKRALSNALSRKGRVDGLVFHSDRGCQYSSVGFNKMLELHGIKGSMSKAGCPFDNSCVESFFATTKKERIYRKNYVTMGDVESDMFEYIELFYNRKRIHSTLGYLSPVEYRMQNEANKTA